MGVRLCECLMAHPNLQDVRPETVTVNTKDGIKVGLSVYDRADKSTLLGTNDTAAFLSTSCWNSEWTQADGCWQVCCTLVAMVCRQNPFLREDIASTMDAIKHGQADLSGAGNLKRLCQQILKFGKSVESYDELALKL